MSTEFTIGGANTGSTLVAVVRRDSDEKAWRTDTSVWETFSDASQTIGHYDSVLTEQGSSGYFVGNFPTAITDSGDFNISYYTRTGSSPTYTYSYETTVSLTWNGTSVAAGATGLSWVSASDYKTLYSITDTSLDAFLALAIPLVSAQLNSYMGRTIKATDLVKVYRGSNLPMLNLREFPVNSLTSVVFDYLDSLPNTVAGTQFYTSPVGTMYFKPSSSQAQCFDSQFISVSMNAGYSTVPGDLQLACMIMVNEIVLKTDPNLLVSVKSFKDETIKYDVIATGTGMPDIVKEMLQQYRFPPII